jgi:hypothetical protein
MNFETRKRIVKRGLTGRRENVGAMIAMMTAETAAHHLIRKGRGIRVEAGAEVVKEGRVNTRSMTKGTNIAVVTMRETVVATGAIETKIPQTKINHGDGMNSTTATMTESESTTNMARMTLTKTRNVTSEMIGVVERTEATEVKVLMIAANTNDTATKAGERGVTETTMTKAKIGENEGPKTTVETANVTDGRRNTQVMMTITTTGVEVGSAIKLDQKVADHEGSVTRIGIEGVAVGVLASLS